MANDELKKKIIDMLQSAKRCIGQDCNTCKYKKESANYIGVSCMTLRIADELIAAGIGDVKERKFEADHYWSMWQGSLVELERAEHRAEVYERALYHTAISGTEYQEAIEQAEKELAEEKNE